jgi:hypothetical protein
MLLIQRLRRVPKKYRRAVERILRDKAAKARGGKKQQFSKNDN